MRKRSTDYPLSERVSLDGYVMAVRRLEGRDSEGSF